MMTLWFNVSCCTEGFKVQIKILHPHSVTSNQPIPLYCFLTFSLIHLNIFNNYDLLFLAAENVEKQRNEKSCLLSGLRHNNKAVSSCMNTQLT